MIGFTAEVVEDGIFHGSTMSWAKDCIRGGKVCLKGEWFLLGGIKFIV